MEGVRISIWATIKEAHCVIVENFGTLRDCLEHLSKTTAVDRMVEWRSRRIKYQLN